MDKDKGEENEGKKGVVRQGTGGGEGSSEDKGREQGGNRRKDKGGR